MITSFVLNVLITGHQGFKQGPDSVYYYALGQAGMSVHLTEVFTICVYTFFAHLVINVKRFYFRIILKFFLVPLEYSNGKVIFNIHDYINRDIKET